MVAYFQFYPKCVWCLLILLHSQQKTRHILNATTSEKPTAPKAPFHLQRITSELVKATQANGNLRKEEKCSQNVLGLSIVLSNIQNGLKWIKWRSTFYNRMKSAVLLTSRHCDLICVHLCHLYQCPYCHNTPYGLWDVFSHTQVRFHHVMSARWLLQQLLHLIFYSQLFQFVFTLYIYIYIYIYIYFFFFFFFFTNNPVKN